MKNKFEGTGVAMVTPFHVDGSIDFPSLEKLVKHLENGGVDYLVVMGTTGESATLTKKEKKEVLQFILEMKKKETPVVYGIGGNNTAEVLETIKETDFTGISAILSVSPYYNKPPQEGIYQHYVKVADTSPVPVILYNVPGRTASNIAAATTIRLSEHKNIAGIKEASGNLEQCMEIAKGKRKDFLLISGDDMLTVPMISFGAKGVISVLANAYPRSFTTMVNEALNGNFKAAAEQLYKFVDVNPHMYSESNPVGVKASLALKGVSSGQVRLPLLKASDGLVEKIKKAADGLE